MKFRWRFGELQGLKPFCWLRFLSRLRPRPTKPFTRLIRWMRVLGQRRRRAAALHIRSVRSVLLECATGAYDAGQSYGFDIE